MSKRVGITRLVEKVNDQGETYLHGFLGMALIIGWPGRPTQDGNATWLISVVEPDELTREKKRAYRQRRRARDEGVVQLGGYDE